MDENIDWSKLSKKERKKLAKELKRKQEIETQKKSNFGKWVFIGIVALIIIVGVVWIIASVVKEAGKPLSGKEVSILGRNHVPVGTKIKYNSNPPTSGEHYSTWTKGGVYDKETDDGYLVHSLEHGYVVISHNCEMTNSKLNPRFNRGQNSKLGTGSAETNKTCVGFVEKLKERVKKDTWKLILVPRSTLDTNFALTSWGRIDKFNLPAGKAGIDDASIERVNNFIDAFRNTGPEKTID